MQFSKFIAAAAALAVAQAVEFTDAAGSFSEITAGKTFNFTWADATGAVTLTLKNGGANNLQTVNVIQSGLTGTSYLWSVPETLINGETYAVEIEDSTGVPNYSTQFQLIGGASSSASAASSTSSGSSTGSSSTGSSTSTSSGSSTTSTGSSTSASTTSSKSSASKTSSGSSTGSQTSSSTGAASTTTAPKSSASGLSSPIAFVFLALAAFFTLN